MKKVLKILIKILYFPFFLGVVIFEGLVDLIELICIGFESVRDFVSDVDDELADDFDRFFSKLSKENGNCAELPNESQSDAGQTSD